MLTALPQGLATTRSFLLSSLVTRVLGEPRADHSLALGFIGSETKRSASLQLLAKINTHMGLDFKRVSSLALVGLEHCRLHGLAKPEQQFRDLYVKASWGKRLQQMEIDFKVAFNSSKSERIAVLKEMVKKPDFDLPTLLAYTRAFDISQEEGLTLYSEALLHSLQPKVGQERGEVLLEDFTTTTDKIDAALKLVSSEDVLYEHLCRMLSTVCPYNYGVLQYLLGRLQGTRTYRDNPPPHLAKADRILGFLLQYKRVSEPSPELEVSVFSTCSSS